MNTPTNYPRPMGITLLLGALWACLFVPTLSLTRITANAGTAQNKAEKALANWKTEQEAVASAKAKLADAQKVLQNAMTAVVKSGEKPTSAQEAALEKGRAAVAEAEAALRQAERQELAARVALENEIAELPDGPLKDRLKRERNFPSLVIANGLHRVTFDTPSGQLTVNLPDDMRAGDTISGTVFTEPKGDTAEEKAKNQSVLNGYVLDLDGTKISAARPRFTWTPSNPQPQTPSRYQIRIVEVLGRPYEQTPGAGVFILPTTQSGAGIMPDPKTAPTFNIPPLGQTGRPFVITGPFDGNSSNTTLNAVSAPPSVPVFEKPLESIGRLGLIAESTRKAVFQVPTNVTGTIEITVKDGDKQTTGNHRNVGVTLSAPKTSLLRGERTTLTVQVEGLTGIKEPVTMTLESTGVINMEGGPYQSLMIQPSQINADGRYTTARGITGVQAGGWGATATVVTNPSSEPVISVGVVNMSLDLESLRQAEAAAQAAADQARQTAESAEQDTRNAQAQADAARKAAEDELKKINKANNEIAEAEAARNRVNSGASTQEERDAAKAAVDKANADLAAAQKAREEAKAAAANAQSQADEAAKMAAEKKAAADKAAAAHTAAEAALAAKEAEILKAQQDAAAAQAAKDKEAAEARARDEARVAADKAAMEKLWAEDIERRRQAQKNLDARALEVDYLLDNIKKLGLITYKPKTNVPDPLDYVFDKLRQLAGQTAGNFAQTVAGELGGSDAAPGGVIGALGELYKSVGSFFDPRTGFGQVRILDRLQGMTKPGTNPPRRYTEAEAHYKLNKMQELMKELRDKLEAAMAGATK